EPAAAVTFPAVVRIFAPAVPTPLVPAAGGTRLTVPAPAFRMVPGAWGMEPPVAFAPPVVATAVVPPQPTVTVSRGAPPGPPAAPFTLMATAPPVALVVVIEPPAPIVKLSAPALLVLALMVTVPEVAPPTFALRTTASPLESVMAPLPVEIGLAMVSVPV